jgi:curli biogenesis system outer membrane secretion channel CsgG
VALAWAVVAAILSAGCEPARPPLFDAEALRAIQRMVVLPLADAPGDKSSGSGKVARGVLVTELLQAGRFKLVSLSEEEFQAALKKVGYVAEDSYDSAMAAAVAKEMQADAVLVGELPHYGTQQEQASTAVLIVAGGRTETTHWVSVSIRIIRASDAKIIYTGSGTASAKEGYSPAAQAACRQALAALTHLLKQPAEAE